MTLVVGPILLLFFLRFVYGLSSLNGHLLNPEYNIIIQSTKVNKHFIVCISDASINILPSKYSI